MSNDKHADHLLGASGTIAALIGYSVIFLLPSFLEAATLALNLNEQQVGWLGAVETGGLATSTLVCAIFITKLNMQRLVLWGVALALLANVASYFSADVSSLLFCRFFAGLGGGLLVTAGMTSLAKTANPDRWFAIYTAAAVVLQALGLFSLPVVIAQWQLGGVLVCFAILLLLPLVLRRFLPDQNSHANSQASTSDMAVDPGGISGGGVKVHHLVLASVAILCFYTSLGAVWTYVASIGTAAGFSFDAVSTALSISMIGGFAGAVLLVILGPWVAGGIIMLVSGLVMLCCLYLMSTPFSLWQFTWILVVYSIVWSIIASRLFSLIAIGDWSGRFITISQPVLNIGFALGPLIASGLIVDFSYAGVLGLAALALLISTMCIFPLAEKTKTSERIIAAQKF